MTQRTAKIAQLPTHCSHCHHFSDFQEGRSRGWCNLLDRVSFGHHPSTSNCQVRLVDEEALIRSSFEVRSHVKVIDSTKDHTEWSTFIVIGKKYNPHRYRNTDTYLSQCDWYYLLATIDNPIVGLLWVAEDEICHYAQSHIIELEGVF